MNLTIKIGGRLTVSGKIGVGTAIALIPMYDRMVRRKHESKEN